MADLMPTAHFPDISHWEPEVQFHDIQKGGCPLVITKCAEGCGYVDPTYQDYAERVRTVDGLVFGSYVFEDAAPEGPQIAHYFNAAHLQAGDLQPVLDAEAAGLTKDETNAALEDMDRRGYRPIPYWSLAFWRDVMGSPTDRFMWLAAYRNDLPDLPADVKLFAWQHTQAGTCPGVAIHCDMNYLYVPVSDLPKFCI